MTAPIQRVGSGGAGKSTVGAALARRLGGPFQDLDRECERPPAPKVQTMRPPDEVAAAIHALLAAAAPRTGQRAVHSSAMKDGSGGSGG